MTKPGKSKLQQAIGRYAGGVALGYYWLILSHGDVYLLAIPDVGFKF